MEAYLRRIDRGEAEAIGFADHYHPFMEVHPGPEQLSSPEKLFDCDRYAAEVRGAQGRGYRVYLGLEVTPENMLVIQNLGAGQCLFKDLYNRVGVLQFDPVFQDLFDIFSTTPTEDVEEPEPEELEPEEPEPEEPEPEEPEPQEPEPEEPEPETPEPAVPEPLLDFEFTEDDLFTKEDI